jgi:hypothetical protein
MGMSRAAGASPLVTTARPRSIAGSMLTMRGPLFWDSIPHLGVMLNEVKHLAFPV